MKKIVYSVVNSAIIFGLFLILNQGHCEGALTQPKNCDRQEALLRAKYVYTYQYTITTSSSFVGATQSSSGSQVTCTVTVTVPRKCELTLQLSACDLQESSRNGGYTKSVDMEFINSLERFPVYFQMDKGVVLEDSIVVADEEPVDILNIKRGLISQLQFPFLESLSTTVEKDVFGSCPVEYTFSQDSPKTVTSRRNLRECLMPQVFKRQFPSPLSSVKRQLGGFIEQKISEAIYPFVSEVTCDYTLGGKKTLDSVSCLQQQYFKPLSYHGDILATAMANISQQLKLDSYKYQRNQPRPNYDLTGRHITGLKFEFTDDHMTQADQSQLVSLLTKINDNFDEEDNEMTPDYFGDLVESCRGTTLSVLKSVKDHVFSCGKECSKVKLHEQNIFMDVLASCGTDDCLDVFLECIQNDQVGRIDGSMFLQSLASYHTVTETFLGKMFQYCKSSGRTSCWLSLGTLLGKHYGGEDAELKVESVLGQALLHMRPILKSMCSPDSTSINEKELVQLFKMVENIGFSTVSKFYAKAEPGSADGPVSKMLRCLMVPSMPKHAIQSMLQVTHEGIYALNFNVHPEVPKVLFGLLKDVTKDSVLRATAFTLLMKTTDRPTINDLVNYMNEPNTRQMEGYMLSNVRTMLENDDPTLKLVRAAWEEVKRGNEKFPSLWPPFDSHYRGISKTINILQLFKLPITEYLGGQLYADIVFDPSAIVFSQFKISVNYFHGDNKYNIIEVTADVQGFDMLFETLLGRNKLSLMQLYALYQQSKSQGQGEAGSLYDKFQKDLIAKVMQILEEVNHPKFPDFEVGIDIKVFGKNVHFLSLSELIGYIRQFQAHAAPNQPTMMQKMMGLLKQGIHRHLFSFKEMMSLVKQIPTCAGLPLNMTVRTNVFHSIKADIGADVSAYLQKTGPLTANLDVSGRVAAELKGEMLIPVGTRHSSGISLRALIGGGKSVGTKLTYSHVLRARDSKIPFSGTMQLDVRNMDEGKDSQTLIYAKSDMFILHNSDEVTVKGDPTVEKTYTRCLPDWLVMATGRSLCVNFVYPDVKTSKTHAYFPLSGPSDLKLVLQRADPCLPKRPRQTVQTQIRLLLKKQSDQDLPCCYPGSRLNRIYYKNITLDTFGKTFEMLTSIPEMGLEKRLFLGTSNGGGGLELMVYTWIQQAPFVGFFLKMHRGSEVKDGKTHSEGMVHLNVTAAKLGWDIYMKESSVKDQADIETDYEGSFKYYCSRSLPLFYILHMNPLHAAENGDLTQIGLKNNVKTKILSVEPSTWKADDTFTLDYPGQTVTIVTDLHRVAEGAHRNSVISYIEDGETVTINMNAEVSNHSDENGMNFDYNFNVDADDFNVLMNGKVTGQPTDFNFNMETTYTKTENMRRKRSLSKIYEKFREFEKATVNKLIEAEEAIMGKSKPSLEMKAKAKDTGSQNPKPGSMQFPPMPLYPSIWDLPKWTATIDVNVRAQPVMGPQPGPPKGMEFVWTMDMKHPWMGGYRENAHTGKFGRNMMNSFRKFNYWFDISETITYTSLDGVNMEIPHFPNPLQRSAHFHIERESGHNFDTKFQLQSPLINFLYLIVFDWNAVGHHKPLLHVKSSQKTRIIPIFDHEYEEFFTYEPGHIKHTGSLQHKLLSLSLDTEIDFDKTEITGLQNGSFSVHIPVLNIQKSFDIMNKFEMKREPRYPRFTLSVVPASAPDKSLVYEVVLEHPKAISIHHHVEQNPQITLTVVPASAPDKSLVYEVVLEHPKAISIHHHVEQKGNSNQIDLWKSMLELKGSSTLQYTYEWFEIYDKTVRSLTVANLYQLAAFLQHIAEQMEKDLGYGIIEKHFILTYHDSKQRAFEFESPKHFMRTYILPKLVLVNSMIERFVSNFVMLKYRQALMNQPGPYVPPRFRLMVQSSVFREKVPASAALQVIERLTYYGAKLSVPLVYKLAGKLEEKLQNRQERKFVMALPLPFKKESFMQFPKPKEAMKYAFSLLRQIREKIYGDRKFIPERMAVVFGREGSDRPLNIMTFDETVLQIPADLAGTCSYLLMADTTRRNAAVIITPTGLSLVTSGNTITLGYDKNVYVNDCKMPLNTSPELPQLNGVSVQIQTDRISVGTEQGLTLICYLHSSDVCVIAWSGFHHNGTVGLLGTNDLERYTDRRKPAATIAESFAELLSTYAVSGPAECHGTPMPKQAPQQDLGPALCNKELHQKCVETFTSSFKPAYDSCPYYLSTSAFQDVCIRESHRCDSDDEDICHAYLAYSRLCERANLDPGLAGGHDACKEVSESDDISSSGSLDIVFIVSQHTSMASSLEPWQYMFELLSFEMDFPYSEVRVGVVGFAGLDESHAPYVIKQDGSYFTELDDLDWSAVRRLHAEGTEKTDGFEAINLAASFPFKPTSHKMIVLMMTKEQVIPVPSDTSVLQDTLVNKSIFLNVFSTYPKLKSRKVIGIDWESRVISPRNNLQELKDLPKNNYIELMKATRGAVFDILTISRGRERKIDMILKHFIHQTQQSDQSACSAA